MPKKEDKEKQINEFRAQIIELTRAAVKLAMENQELKHKLKKRKSHK